MKKYFFALLMFFPYMLSAQVHEEWKLFKNNFIHSYSFFDLYTWRNCDGMGDSIVDAFVIKPSMLGILRKELNDISFLQQTARIVVQIRYNLHGSKEFRVNTFIPNGESVPLGIARRIKAALAKCTSYHLYGNGPDNFIFTLVYCK